MPLAARAHVDPRAGGLRHRDPQGLPGTIADRLARDLDVPPEMDVALESLARGELAGVDVGEVNGEPFLSAVALGLGAEACALREQVREVAPVAWPETVFDAVRRFAGARPLQLRPLGDDGLALTFTSQAVFVANGPFSRRGFALIRRESLQTGRLAPYAQRQPGRWAALLTLLRARIGGFADTDIIAETLPSRRLDTRARRLLATIDGELATLASPLDFTSRPRALRVRRPALVAPNA
ncbi:MAG: diacylglycerol/lipid kinase family protein [Alphaproteobacteria bacterium]